MPIMRGCTKCKERSAARISALYDEEKRMKTVEIMGKPGVIAVPEKDLGHYKSRGYKMVDGSEIKIPGAKKAEPEKKIEPEPEKKEKKKDKPKE